MGHSSSRMPYPVSITVLNMVTDELVEQQVRIDRLPQSALRHFQRKLQRRVNKYLNTTFTAEQLNTISYASDGLSEINANQWHVVRRIVRDAVTHFRLQHVHRTQAHYPKIRLHRLSEVACTTVVKQAQLGKLPECSICLNEFQLNDHLVTLICFHFFHTECFICWFRNNTHCPLCWINLAQNNENVKSTTKSDSSQSDETVRQTPNEIVHSSTQLCPTN